MANHFSSMCYQGPFLISEKLDGQIVSIMSNGEKIDVFKEDGEGWTIPYKGPEFVMFGELMDGHIYWLETKTRRCHTLLSWISGLRAWLPDWLGIKNYFPLGQTTLEEMMGKVREGVVIHDPHTPCGSGMPRQWFVKHRPTCDIMVGDGRLS